MAKRSLDAGHVYEKFKDGRWITWKDLREALGNDHVRIAVAWNELLDEGVAEGLITHRRPRPRPHHRGVTTTPPD